MIHPSSFSKFDEKEKKVQIFYYFWIGKQKDTEICTEFFIE